MTLPVRIEGLVVRRIAERDFSDLLAYYSDATVARYQFWGPFDEEQVEQLILSQGSVAPGDPGVRLVLAVELQNESRVIGDCSLTITSIDDRQAEIGFAFHPRYCGCGYATRAVRAVLGYAFEELGMHRVIAATDTRNERSWKLMERIGMRREAHFLHDCRAKGEWVDDYLYAMLDDEWRAL